MQTRILSRAGAGRDTALYRPGFTGEGILGASALNPWGRNSFFPWRRRGITGPAALSGNPGRTASWDHGSLYKYLALRLDYEAGVYEPALLLNQMMKETEHLRADFPGDERAKLIQAELLILNGREDNASLL